MSDRIAAIVLFLFALYYGFEAWRLESGFGSGVVEPKDFPVLLAGGLVLFAMGILFRVDPDPDWFTPPQWLDVVVLTAVLRFMPIC